MTTRPFAAHRRQKSVTTMGDGPNFDLPAVMITAPIFDDDDDDNDECDANGNNAAAASSTEGVNGTVDADQHDDDDDDKFEFYISDNMYGETAAGNLVRPQPLTDERIYDNGETTSNGDIVVSMDDLNAAVDAANREVRKSASLMPAGWKDMNAIVQATRTSGTDINIRMALDAFPNTVMQYLTDKFTVPVTRSGAVTSGGDDTTTQESETPILQQPRLLRTETWQSFREIQTIVVENVAAALAAVQMECRTAESDMTNILNQAAQQSEACSISVRDIMRSQHELRASMKAYNTLFGKTMQQTVRKRLDAVRQGHNFMRVIDEQYRTHTHAARKQEKSKNTFASQTAFAWQSTIARLFHMIKETTRVRVLPILVETSPLRNELRQAMEYPNPADQQGMVMVEIMISVLAKILSMDVNRARQEVRSTYAVQTRPGGEGVVQDNVQTVSQMIVRLCQVSQATPMHADATKFLLQAFLFLSLMCEECEANCTQMNNINLYSQAQTSKKSREYHNVCVANMADTAKKNIALIDKEVDQSRELARIQSDIQKWTNTWLALKDRAPADIIIHSHVLNTWYQCVSCEHRMLREQTTALTDKTQIEEIEAIVKSL